MAVPNKPFYLSAVKTELGLSGAQWMSQAAVRNLAGAPSSGAFWLGDLAGKSSVEKFRLHYRWGARLQEVGTSFRSTWDINLQIYEPPADPKASGRWITKKSYNLMGLDEPGQFGSFQSFKYDVKLEPNGPGAPGNLTVYYGGRLRTASPVGTFIGPPTESNGGWIVPSSNYTDAVITITGKRSDGTTQVVAILTVGADTP